MLRYRFLFEQMVRRELRQKYKGSALGVLWYLVNPLVLMGAYALVFSVLLKVADIPDYPLFLLVGLIVWVFFAQALLAAAPSLVTERAAGAQGALPARDDPGVGGHGAARHLPGDARAWWCRWRWWCAASLDPALLLLLADRGAAVRARARAVAGGGGAARPLPRRRAGAGRRAAAVVLPHPDLPAGGGHARASPTAPWLGDLLRVGQPGRAVHRGGARRALRGRRAVGGHTCSTCVAAGALALRAAGCCCSGGWSATWR